MDIMTLRKENYNLVHKIVDWARYSIKHTLPKITVS